MMSNYFHDVATATILALAVTLWLVLKTQERTKSEVISYMVRSLRKVMLFCLFWLFGGGVVRILAFSSYEIPEATGKGLLVGLFAKHILAFTLVLSGGIIWQRQIKRYRETLRKGQQPDVWDHK